MSGTGKPHWMKILLWLASVGSSIGLMILGARFINEDNAGLFLEFAVITVVTLVYLYLISGKKTFTYLNNQTGYTVRTLAPILIFPGIFSLFGVLSWIMDRPPAMPGWSLNFLLAAANMFMVGIYEEGCFRACACDALLPALRKTRHPFLFTALISGLLFGYVHVVSVDFSNLQETLQFVLKIVNLLISGSMYMILYWKTRNLLGLAIVHGLYDFIPDFMNQIFLFPDVENTGSYTTGDVGTTIVYVIQLVFSLLCLLYVYRKVARKLDYKKILEEW